MQIEVSVIIAVFNDENNIGNCIESVLNQSHKNFELIIVNDASTDNTLDIVKQYSKIDTRIKYFSNRTNKAQAYSRNIAINNSQGDIIAIIDSDCVARNDWLKNLISGLKNENIVMGNSLSTKENIWAKEIFKQYKKWFSSKNKGNYLDSLDTKNCAIRKIIFEKIGLFDPKASPSEDTELAIRVKKADFKIRYAEDAIITHKDPTRLLSQFYWAKKRAFSHFYITKKHNQDSPKHAKDGLFFFISLILLLIASIAIVFSEFTGFFILILFVILFLFSFNAIIKNIIKTIIRKDYPLAQFILSLIRDLGFKYGHFQRILRIKNRY